MKSYLIGLAAILCMFAFVSSCDVPPSTAVDRAVLQRGLAATSPDLVVIPPTVVSTDPAQQLLNSIATLNAFQDAIDNAPPKGRVIQLEPGLYDFSAVVIIDPARPGKLPKTYSRAQQGLYWYNPHDLSSPFGFGYGVVVLGKDDLTIRDAPPARDGTPTTTIRCNTDPQPQ